MALSTMEKRCKVYTVFCANPIEVNLEEGACAEDVVLEACRQLRVAPITRTLYSLNIRGSVLFVPDATPVVHDGDYDLRIRYKVTNLNYLRDLDKSTFHNLFKQACDDIVNNRVPDLQYNLYKNEVLGMCVAYMYIAMREDKKTPEDFKNDYKKYIPKEIARKHRMFLKKPVYNKLKEMDQIPPKPRNVKFSFFKQLNRLAPNYLSEEYAVEFKQSNVIMHGKIEINPFHSEQPGLRVYSTIENKWTHICTIHQIIFLGQKKDTHVQIYRNNGRSYDLYFKTAAEASSFISGTSGYYRLMVKWMFNLSKTHTTPSLTRLINMKCHGPVSGEFSFKKLDNRVDNRQGCYILRECQRDYYVYFIDYCTKDRITLTCKIEYQGSNYCILYDNDEQPPLKFSSLEDLIKSFGDPDKSIYLKDCIPPSEYEKSQHAPITAQALIHS